MTSYGRILHIAAAAATAILLVVAVPAIAKGNFDKITVQEEGSETQVEVTDPALLGFFAFTDFEDGTLQAPLVVGPAFIVTRWQRDTTGDMGYQPWDRLRYYHTSPDNTLAHGWVFYEGLLNGSSEYDGHWFTSTRSADALMESIIFPTPAGDTQADANTRRLTIGLIGIVAALVIAALAWTLFRKVGRGHSEPKAG